MGTIQLQCRDYHHSISDLSSKVLSTMTIYHYKKARIQYIVNVCFTNGMYFIQISINLDSSCKIAHKKCQPKSYHNDRLEKKNQCWTIQCEFEPIGPTMLKNPLDARWELLPTLQWMGSCL